MKMEKKNILEFKKVNDNYYLTGSEFDGSKNIKNILDSSSKSIFANFKNLNTYIYLDIGKYFVNNESYLSNVLGKIQIKNNKIFNSNITAKLNKKRKFKLNIVTNDKREKVTILEIEKPEFIEWQWLKIENLPHVIVDFKKKVYEQLLPKIRSYIN